MVKKYLSKDTVTSAIFPGLVTTQLPAVSATSEVFASAEGLNARATGAMTEA